MNNHHIPSQRTQITYRKSHLASRATACCLLLTACCLLAACTGQPSATSGTALKDALGKKFLIGTALNSAHISGVDTLGVKVVKTHFNAIVAENCMKSMYLQPEDGRFVFDEADRFVDFGTKNDITVTGHCLVWHSQAPLWLFTDVQGKDVSRETLIERLRSHITTVVSRYKGRVKGWDVVNEAINDDGSFRESKFYQIIGEDFIRLAFEFAHAADPDAELYYNDYSMANPEKCAGVVRLVKSLQAQGVRIDAVGMQGHHNMEWPSVEAFEQSLLAFAELGVKVMITELDLSVLPRPQMNTGADVSAYFEYMKEMNPYADGLPEDVAATQQARYADFFRLFLKHHDKITRVTLWGVSDGDSWCNNWPMPGRTDYPLLFDRQHQPKPVVEEIAKMAKQ
jgi:endo-1,4-beta-xylanase